MLNPKVPLTLSRLIMDCVQNRPSLRPQDMGTIHSRLELALSVAHTGLGDNIAPQGSGMPQAIPQSSDDTDDAPA